MHTTILRSSSLFVGLVLATACDIEVDFPENLSDASTDDASDEDSGDESTAGESETHTREGSPGENSTLGTTSSDNEDFAGSTPSTGCADGSQPADPSSTWGSTDGSQPADEGDTAESSSTSAADEAFEGGTWMADTEEG